MQLNRFDPTVCVCALRFVRCGRKFLGNLLHAVLRLNECTPKSKHKMCREMQMEAEMKQRYKERRGDEGSTDGSSTIQSLSIPLKDSKNAGQFLVSQATALLLLSAID